MSLGTESPATPIDRPGRYDTPIVEQEGWSSELPIAGPAYGDHAIGGGYQILDPETQQLIGGAVYSEGIKQDDLPNISRPLNLTPEGTGRSGAFNQAKRDAGIPTSQQPAEVLPNEDRRGTPQPGYQYVYEVPTSGGGVEREVIRYDAGGHIYIGNSSQNRGAHFNTPDGSHYDY